MPRLPAVEGADDERPEMPRAVPKRKPAKPVVKPAKPAVKRQPKTAATSAAATSVPAAETPDERMGRRELAAEFAAEGGSTKRKCTARARVRRPDGFVIRDEEGRALLRPCERAPLKGQRVCWVHGGANRNSLAKAESQLKASRDKLMSFLLEIAENPDVKPEVRLKAQQWALERTGFHSRAEIDMALKPWQQMLLNMQNGGTVEPSTEEPSEEA